MTDQVLDILKLVLLALLYLFFARVLWAVWSEVRQPNTNRQSASPGPAYQPGALADPTPAGGRQLKPSKGRSGVPGRLVVLEPKERRGVTFAIGSDQAGVGVGRDVDNIIVITDDAFVSGHHARISFADGRIVLDDLGSRNGTFLNGSRISSRRPLSIGDRVQIGYTVVEAQ